jgi:hypothetical protein
MTWNWNAIGMPAKNGIHRIVGKIFSIQMPTSSESLETPKTIKLAQDAVREFEATKSRTIAYVRSHPPL